MSETTVEETVEFAGAAVQGAEVVITLVTSLTDTFAPGYTSTLTIFDQVTKRTDATGEWTADLVPNAEILDPLNTAYRLDYRLPRGGGKFTKYIEVPISGSAVQVADILVDAPTNLADGMPASRLPGLRAACIGDSNTLGYTPNAGTYWQVETSWYTQAVHGSRGALRHVVNNGVATTTSTQMLARIQAEVLDLEPDVCFIMAGTNDNNGSNTTTLAVTAANIVGMVRLCRAARVTPVLLTIPPRDDAYADEARLINAWLHYWCLANRVDLIDAYSELVDASDGGFVAAYTQDGLHLTVEGAQRVAQRVVDWAYAHCTAGVPFRTQWDDESAINLVAGSCFVDALGGSNAPPGWTIVGEVTGDSTFALVAPVEADHVPTAMRGNWYEITKAESAATTYITQSISTGWSVGDTLGFSGRVQVPDALTGDGTFGLYISFTGSAGVFLFPIYEWTEECDAGFYIERDVPASTTAVAVLAVFQRVSGDVSGVVRFGEVTIANITTEAWETIV